jgi:REase_DpnII-MboI
MSTHIDLANPPEKFWHCAVKLTGEKFHSLVNDLSFSELQRTIVVPWNCGKTFTVSGTVVRSSASVSEIKITHTSDAQQSYAERHNARMSANGVSDFATNRRMLPLSQGTDLTYELLFSGTATAPQAPDVAMVEQICKRLPHSARVLALRSRKGKIPFEVADEYDVQDLLHAVLRAYLKYSVQEDPLPKVAGAKSSRIDVSIEELGILIEVKYVRGPADQKRIFEEYSQDLLLYAEWAHLKTLIYLIYNSDDLKDPEAFEKLSAAQEIGGKRFDVRVVLA